MVVALLADGQNGSSQAVSRVPSERQRLLVDNERRLRLKICHLYQPTGKMDTVTRGGDVCSTWEMGCVWILDARCYMIFEVLNFSGLTSSAEVGLVFSHIIIN